MVLVVRFYCFQIFLLNFPLIFNMEDLEKKNGVSKPIDCNMQALEKTCGKETGQNK